MQINKEMPPIMKRKLNQEKQTKLTQVALIFKKTLQYYNYFSYIQDGRGMTFFTNTEIYTNT